jgi:hypothetical protein
VERALDREDLALALGELPEVPQPDDLQRLLADAELSLFTGEPEVSDTLIRAGWYLHAVASAGGGRIPWPRRERAFRVSAHILELAAQSERPRAERLELVFGSALGYRRGGLDPNAMAVFTQARPFLSQVDQDEVGWSGMVSVEAGIYLLSFRTAETFRWLRQRRRGFAQLRVQTGRRELAGTMFGPSERIVESCFALLRFLIFGDRPALQQARSNLRAALDYDAEPATTNERWVAAH